MPVQYQRPLDMRQVDVSIRGRLYHPIKAQIDRTMLMETEA